MNVWRHVDWRRTTSPNVWLVGSHTMTDAEFVDLVAAHPETYGSEFDWIKEERQ